MKPLTTAELATKRAKLDGYLTLMGASLTALILSSGIIMSEVVEDHTLLMPALFFLGVVGTLGGALLWLGHSLEKTQLQLESAHQQLGTEITPCPQ